MRPLGYMYKRVASRPEWLQAPQVRDICSLSGCISSDFADYIKYWKHNGFWLFDSPAIIQTLTAEQSISLEGLTLFYYEGYEQEYDEDERSWTPFEPEASFATEVVAPAVKILRGFDVTTFSSQTSPECSPLSCNACASSIPTNSHCLFSTFEDAVRALDTGQFGACEQGPYRITAVYSVEAAKAEVLPIQVTR